VTTPSPDRIAVGRINGVWGLRGHVKVTPLTSNAERLVTGATLYVAGAPRRILDVVSPQGYPCIRFEGFPDRTAAEALRGALIEIDEADLAPLPEGEYYLHDLEGLEVVTVEGERIGRLKEVLTTGANDVYVITRDTKADALIPAIADVVLSVDLEARRMTIDPLPGILD
jgi:16S rRNA processing protein RimM